MKKIVCIFSVAIVLLLMSVSGFAITTYKNAPGGEVTNVDELISAFGGNATKALWTESGIVLSSNVVLCDTIVIKEGSYTIIGAGCGIYRGFDNAPLIKLENGAFLTLEKSSQRPYVDDSDHDLLLSGRKAEFPNGGALISVCSGAELTVNSEVVFENSISNTLGGAIYAEGTSKVTLTNCGFRSCSSSVGGGAIAFVSDKLGNEGGSLNTGGVSFKENSASKGGAIYAYGGVFNASGCIFEKNTADVGGAMWLCSEATVSKCDASYNEANVSGAFVCVGSDDAMVGKLNVIEGMYMNNTSRGNGGFSSNYGAMIIGGSYISDNVAAGDGGAVYNEGSLAFTEGTLLSNTAGGRGGGVCSVGKGSVFVMSGGEINSNKALFGAGVFCQGSFSMNGGAIGNNRGDGAGVVAYQTMTLSGTPLISETVALCFNGESYPSIKINGKLPDDYAYNIILVSEKTDKNGNVSRYVLENSSGAQVLLGDVAKNAEKFFIKSSFLRYGVNSNGKMMLRFPFFPDWVWICVLVLVLLSAVTVFYFKIGKKIISSKKENS